MKKKLLLSGILLMSSLMVFTQERIDSSTSSWPYSMPIFGKEAVKRGYKIQLPYGLNVNYVYNRMDLEISEFDMTIGDDPNSNINQIIKNQVNLETLNFTNTIARTNGMNLRADVWIFPFLNVYGIYANNTGSTEVSLKPRWFDEEGNLLLALEEVESTVDFSANSYGVGTTVVTKLYEDYFISLDANITWSYSDLLEDAAVFNVVSARIGDRVQLGKESFLAIYVGGMYRGFIDNQGNAGAITISEALPSLGAELFPAIDERVEANNEKIAQLDPNTPVGQAQIAVLEKKNAALREIESAMEGLLGTDVNYNIKKDIINHWSVQFGFNLEINPKLTIRGEFGKGTGNDFVMTGIQYRFGL